MNIVKFEEIKKELKVATKNITLLRKGQSEADSLKEELLHQLENEDRLNACDGYKFAKALKDVQNKRRIIKDGLMENKTIVEQLTPFIKAYELTLKNINISTVKGKEKYTKNFTDINIKIQKLKIL